MRKHFARFRDEFLDFIWIAAVSILVVALCFPYAFQRKKEREKKSERGSERERGREGG